MNNNLSTMNVGERALTVREITIEDTERLRRMFNRLSPDSVYRRFFSPINEPSRTALLWLTSVDHDHREALVALDGDEIVAVARYDGHEGEPTAEIAVTVEDSWQHLGVGQRLTKRLARRAIDHGIESFEMVVQPDNRAALGLCASSHPKHPFASTTASTRQPPRSAVSAYAALVRAAVALGAIDQPVHEPQTRPRVVDRAHLVVDETVREPDLTHDALAQIGRDSGRALRPRDPQTAGSASRARERVEASFQLGESRREEEHDIVLAARLMA